MTIIRVSPQSVRDYGTKAEEIFGTIITTLQTNVDELVAIRYHGPNAVTFKRHIGELCATFGNELYLDIVAMATAVHTATSNIAHSLGGSGVTIDIAETKITPGVVSEVDFVDVDTTALAEGLTTVGSQFTALRMQLVVHVAALGATDWEGAAKESVVAAVGSYTKQAIDTCNDAELMICDYINDQLDAVQLADASADTAA